MSPPIPVAAEVDPVGVLEQIFLLPFAYLWFPGLIFAFVVGGAYWLSRPARQLAAEPEANVKLKTATIGAAAPKEHRNMLRRPGNPVEVFVANPDDKANPETGSVLDRSMGGMRLALFGEIVVGTVVAVRPVHAEEIVPWVEIEVRSCKPSTEMPGQFEVGCQYVKSPPYSIQLLFG